MKFKVNTKQEIRTQTNVRYNECLVSLHILNVLKKLLQLSVLDSKSIVSVYTFCKHFFFKVVVLIVLSCNYIYKEFQKHFYQNFYHFFYCKM